LLQSRSTGQTGVQLEGSCPMSWQTPIMLTRHLLAGWM